MRKALTGFACGYLMIVLVVAPAVLCALGKAPSYGDGVVAVLNQTGVLSRVKNGVDEAAETRDRLLNQLAVYIARKLGPALPDAPNEADMPLVRRG
jgi:hypothetical protein